MYNARVFLMLLNVNCYVVFIYFIIHNVMVKLFTHIADLECIFTVICNLVKKTDSLDEALEMAKLIATKVTQQPNDKPALRLKM